MEHSISFYGLFEIRLDSVTAFVPKCGYEILQSQIQKSWRLLMYRKSLFLIITFDKPQSMLLVQGLGQETETQKKVLDFLKATVPFYRCWCVEYFVDK
jgi:hypothetical protein